MSAGQLRRALEIAEVHVTGEGDDVVAHVRSGLRARRANLALAGLAAGWQALSADHARAAALGFARGVHAVLAEPKGDAGAQLTFEDAARTVLPSIEAPHFRMGALAAGGDEPFTTVFPGGLSVAYRVELDHGIRLLTEAQVQSWGCTGDRLDKAAMSILFHRSWDAPFRPTPERPEIYEFDVGDGLDGARVLMMNQWGYDYVRDGAVCSLPGVDSVLLSTDTSDGGVAALAKLTAARFASSSRPLSDAIFRFERGKILGR